MNTSSEEQIQVLLVTGEVPVEHDPKVSSWLRRMLESTGRFKVKITEEFHGCTAETLSLPVLPVGQRRTQTRRFSHLRQRRCVSAWRQHIGWVERTMFSGKGAKATIPCSIPT